MSVWLWSLGGGAVASALAFLGGYGVGRRKDAELIGALQTRVADLEEDLDAALEALGRSGGADPSGPELDELFDVPNDAP